MSDSFGIDSHKLSLHPARVSRWLEGGMDWETARTIYPIYVEVSPAGACNHRCAFCAVDYIGYKSKFLDAGLLGERLGEMAGLGVKSVMFAGEGEPLLHTGLGGIIAGARRAGIDCSLTTNAVLMTESFLEEGLSSLAWIKVSINGGTPETYAAVHRSPAADFERALGNIRRAVCLKNERGFSVALGAQMVLLPENAAEAVSLARRLRDLGLDYLVIKPYSQHKASLTRRYEGIRYGDYMRLADEIEKVEDGRFHVVFRRRAMAKQDDADRKYTTCYSTPHFWAYVMASGDVYGCSAYLLDERFRYGNLHSETFSALWGGELRRKNLKYVLDELDIMECRKNCRMDEVNRYLWALKYPPPHSNFI